MDLKKEILDSQIQWRSHEILLGGANYSINALTIVHIEYKIINFDILSYS